MIQQGSDMTNLDVVKKFQAEPEMTCYVPKKKIHTYSGHTKGVARIQLFPRYGHLALSASMDGTVKVRIIGTLNGSDLLVKTVSYRFGMCTIRGNAS